MRPDYRSNAPCACRIITAFRSSAQVTRLRKATGSRPAPPIPRSPPRSNEHAATMTAAPGYPGRDPGVAESRRGRSSPSGASVPRARCHGPPASASPPPRRSRAVAAPERAHGGRDSSAVSGRRGRRQWRRPRPSWSCEKRGQFTCPGRMGHRGGGRARAFHRDRVGCAGGRGPEAPTPRL